MTVKQKREDEFISSNQVISHRMKLDADPEVFTWKHLDNRPKTFVPILKDEGTMSDVISVIYDCNSESEEAEIFGYVWTEELKNNDSYSEGRETEKPLPTNVYPTIADVFDGTNVSDQVMFQSVATNSCNVSKVTLIYEYGKTKGGYMAYVLVSNATYNSERKYLL